MNNSARFISIYEKYRRYMYSRVSSVLKEPHDIEDALQEAWIRVYKNLGKISADDGPRAMGYMGTVAVNEALRILSKNNSRPDETEWGTDGLDIIEDISVSVEMRIINAEATEELESSLNVLDDIEKRIFVMKHAYEMKNTEIAGILGISAAKVGMKLFRAAGKLAKTGKGGGDGAEEQ
ncbi:MAG: sigma-70 family RNA polymerase sigma factor [Oscillospiraceae bacterium]|jgi:RNA polymerase sigma-70 factor (ECF subfamily)|nr:sigma-70 family RNA polymerase sigma factor [Oscillospiraceae bacterium]